MESAPTRIDDALATAAAPEVEEAGPDELNQWKRGFTPQAEIWNGRMAMVGLSVGLTVLLIARLSGRV
ncbi:MAG: high light inducible protein [Vulcanococcus sp.]